LVHEKGKVIPQHFADRKTELAAELIDDPDEDAEDDADDDAADDREVERSVLAAMDDVSGEAAEAKRKFPPEVEEGTDEKEYGTENEKRTA